MSQIEYIDEDVPKSSGWYGWIVFAAAFMIITGVFDLITGLAALIKDESYFTGGKDGLLTFNYTTWGWIHIVFAVLLVLVGLALLRGATWARIVGVVIVGLNMIGHFTFSSASPFWAVIAITLDAIIIYALVVHGRDLAE
jgi:hypothetical protein